MKKIPEHYLPVMPYLTVKNAKAFKEFMTEVFGATEQFLLLGPASSSDRDEHIIKHGELKIDDAVIMYGDVTEQLKERPGSMFIYVESVDNVYKAAMAKGAKSLTLPDKKEYGYTAGFEDAFGNQWWVVEGV